MCALTKLKRAHIIHVFPQSDWESHKVMCKALSSLEKNPFAVKKLVSLLPKEPTTDVQQLRKLAGQQVEVYCDYLHGYRSFIIFLPLC
jgi:sensor domain CHASE-containing protein